MNEISIGIAQAMGCKAQVHINRMYPVLVNSDRETQIVQSLARTILGENAVSSDQLPMLGAEDFAYYLQHKPGCFFFLGSGEDGRSNSMCHATNYDFNDNLIPIAVSFWIRLVEDRLNVRLFD